MGLDAQVRLESPSGKRHNTYIEYVFSFLRVIILIEMLCFNIRGREVLPQGGTRSPMAESRCPVVGTEGKGTMNIP